MGRGLAWFLKLYSNGVQVCVSVQKLYMQICLGNRQLTRVLKDNSDLFILAETNECFCESGFQINATIGKFFKPPVAAGFGVFVVIYAAITSPPHPHPPPPRLRSGVPLLLS